MYLACIASIAVLAHWGGFVLLWKDGYHARVTGLLALLLGVLVVPAAVCIAIVLASFFDQYR